jgi:2-dehydro-3-deoxygluconokinase
MTGLGDRRVATFGETMALFTGAGVGSLAHIGDLKVGIGGAESNVAVGLARLGTTVSWLGKVGDDALGTRIVRLLRGEGVDVRAIVDSDAKTGLMLKEHRNSESTRVTYYREGSAGSRLTAADLKALRIESATVLHLTGITPALSPATADAVAAAIDTARAAGVPISFDVNHRDALWNGRDAGAVYREIASQADIVFAGTAEARILTGTGLEHLALAHGMARLGPAQAILKLGPAGCVAVIDGREYEQAAPAVRPVDTVGAGDAFVAGYLAELVDGLPAAERLRTAVTAGTLACLVPGDWEGLPNREELTLLLADEPVAR